MSTQIWIKVSLAAFVMAMSATLANAQDLMRGQTVAQRTSSLWAAKGVGAGAGAFYPLLEIEQLYDDNIFSQDQDTVSDGITIFHPEFLLTSDRERRTFNLEAAADIKQYWDESTESVEDFHFGADTRLEIVRNTSFTARAAFDSRHEDRGSPDDQNGVKPTPYDTLALGVGLQKTGGQFSFSLDANLDMLDYDDVAREDDTVINNDDRDRNEYDIGGQIRRDLTPERRLFVGARYFTRSYDDAIDDNGFDRDSDGFEVVGGFSFDLSGVTVGEISAGYREQDFDDVLFPDINAFTFGASLTSNVSEVTTIIGYLSRTVEETTLDEAAAYLATAVGMRLEHEFSRFLLFKANGSYSKNAYKGIDRDDNFWQLGAELDYLFNDTVYVGAGYRYSSRNTNAFNQDFTKNVLFFRLGLRR